MTVVQAMRDIDAPAQAVWRVLTDLPRFGEWNPFIREAWGRVEVGGEVGVRVGTSLRIPPLFAVEPVFHATITACVPARELRWLGHFLAPWVGRAEHWFLLEPLGAGRIRFVQREMFAGALPRMFGSRLARETRRGFDAMNAALGARVRLMQRAVPWETHPPPGCSSSRDAETPSAPAPAPRPG